MTEISKVSPRNPILNNKIYLYLTEFFAGMAVMAVELGASRLLAPYFSSSQIVWTIIISTIMIAMALGNLYGGKTADRDNDPDRLYGRILMAAVWIAAIPVLGKYIILLISGALILTISSNLLVIAAFIACMAIFVFPCFLLGTVTPSMVKFSVDSLDDSGRTVGRLGAFNTIGSIIGTFLPTFVTIPAVGTSVTFLIFSGVLLVLGLIYFIMGHRGKRACIIAAVLFVICAISGRSDSFAFWEKKLTYEGESIYNYLQVKDSDTSTVLSTNVLFGVQSIRVKDDSLTGMYYDYAMAAPVLAGVNRLKDGIAGEDRDLSVLVLGMGTGTYASQCDRYFDGMNVEGVEIDGKITDLAHTYFNLDESIPVETYDGRAYLQTVDTKYDVIMVDAYQDITIPFQMSSVEFFRLVQEHLNDSGVMVVNMNMRSGSDGINQYLADTISNVFPYVYTADVEGSTNRELFASAADFDKEAFEEVASEHDEADFRNLMAKVGESLVKYSKGEYLLTDDKAPVELLSMQAIDDIIGNEIGVYKKVFEERGLEGLLDSM